MRPIRRGPSPRSGDFANYADAKPDLVSRLGSYCSYCERPILTNLAVEHIQAKADPKYAHLIGRWENFLLGCVNCNSSKLDKDVRPAKVLLPDRDNTFASFVYSPDGGVNPAPKLLPRQQELALATLELVGLAKSKPSTDSNGKMVALDRAAQRMEAWREAEYAKSDLDTGPSNDVLRNRIVALAKATGCFSIWMTVFAHDRDMKQRLIDAFPGTRDSGCFDSRTGDSVSPAPNPDNLPSGGKA